MKKKNKKNQIRMRFPTIVLCILAILLCAAPCNGQLFLGLNYYDGDEYDGDEYFVTEELVNEIRDENELGDGGLDSLDVGADTTVHLYTSVTYSVQAHPGSILNIHSGNIGLYVILSTGIPSPVVTVYGTNFGAKEGGALNPSSTQLTVDNVNGGVLTGTYENGDPIELKFISNIPIYLMEPAVSEVEIEMVVIDIDIKPGGNPNNINLKSNGVVPVAVFTIAGGLDASTIDPGTVKFAGAGPPIRWKICDVDGDGLLDMLFHFKTQDLKLSENDTEATLTGETFDEVGIEGTDTVRIVQSKK